MLKIAEYNKKTGKKIELQELEKYGFEIYGKFAKKVFCEYSDGIALEDDTWLCVDNSVIWLIENGAKESNERYFGNPQLDTLYDLINDGYIEKVEE